MLGFRARNPGMSRLSSQQSYGRVVLFIIQQSADGGIEDILICLSYQKAISRVVAIIEPIPVLVASKG